MNYSKMLSVLGVFSIPFFLMASQCLAHSWMAPGDEGKRGNPIPVSAASAKNGETLFNSLCSPCHGQGAVGLPKEKTGLKTDAPNLPHRLKMHSDGDFHWKILNGRADMPSFQDELSEKEVWDIINYLKTLNK